MNSPLAEMKPKRKMGERVSFEQKDALITYMEGNASVARNQ